MGTIHATHAPASDAELISRWLGGDQRAAGALVERHAPAVARFAASLGEREGVEELVQDTFVRAFASLDGFRSDSALRTWLFTICKRLWLDRRRSERRRREDVELGEAHAATDADALDGLVAEETAARIRAVMTTLSPMQREVFALRVNEGMAYEEIAQVVGSTAGSCRVHYHNAVKLIRERVTDE
ncbi:MAG: hypothetical protein RL139_5 [Gemmatimonadota bacterium]|jgi:RNA polymerase sigma-70 factor, ECF subfamily